MSSNQQLETSLAPLLVIASFHMKQYSCFCVKSNDVQPVYCNYGVGHFPQKECVTVSANRMRKLPDFL